MKKIEYIALLREEPTGIWFVSFPDIPEAVTQGDDINEACENAKEVAELILEEYVETGRTIPIPSDSIIVIPPSVDSRTLVTRLSVSIQD